jgi:hypothetical protein
MRKGLQQRTAHLICAGGMLWQAAQGAGDQDPPPRPPPRRAAFGVGPGRGRGSGERMQGADKRHRGRARRHGVTENGAKGRGRTGGTEGGGRRWLDAVYSQPVSFNPVSNRRLRLRLLLLGCIQADAGA